MFLKNFAYSQNVFLKISPYDCATCTSNLQKVFTIYPQSIIIISSDFSEDSVGIINKFGINKYKNSIIWSSTLYQKIEKELLSEVMIVSLDSEIIWRDNLKNMKIDVFRNVIQEQIRITCFSLLPINLKVKNFNHSLILHNRITDEKFISTNGTLNKLIINDTVIAKIYLSLLKDTLQYNIYINAKNTDERFAPKISSIFPMNDSTISLLVITYVLSEIKEEDSLYDKIATVVTFINYHPIEIHLLDLKSRPKNIGYNEYYFAQYNNDIYLASNEKNDSATNFTFLSKYKLLNDKYVYDKDLEYYLPDYLIQSGIKYNGFSLIYSQKYFLFPYSNHIYNIETKEKYRLPFNDSIYFLNNDFLKTLKSRFFISDFKYDRYNDYFVVLYFLDKKFFIEKIRKSNNKLIAEINVNESFKLDNISAICLSDDGKKLIYRIGKENCLRFINIP